MKTRPTIFISGVSHELGSFRNAVQTEILMKGCYPENQPGFPPDYKAVEEMLRSKLREADAVIHLVGFRFGAEPKERPGIAPRRSYTQMEFDIAREMQKPVYVFLSKDTTVRDKPRSDETAEDADGAALQFAHRTAVQSTNHLYYFFNDKAELRRLVAEIPLIAQAGEFKPDISRIIKYAPAELIGREAELNLLNDAWHGRADQPVSPDIAAPQQRRPTKPHILTFVALGGEGKTSLVAKWAAELAARDWPGCDAAFAWSFYSQGTREQQAASSDLFLKEALVFFGDEADKQFAGSAVGAHEKGQRLARIVGQRRCLLILDGLEPLQYAPTSPTPGQLKDQGIAALLKGLAQNSRGLCVVTTRYSIPDLKAFWQTTAPEVKLLRLSREAGVHLLKSFNVRGSDRRNIPFDHVKELLSEFEKLVEDVKGHALTLNLLGSYLRDAHGGDIRKRDLVKLAEADAEEQSGHAFRVMDAYVKWFEQEEAETTEKKNSAPSVSSCSTPGRRALAVLRLLGLFDRPATAECLAAVWSGEPIPNLTEPLVGLTEAHRNILLTRLEAAKLLTVNRDASGALVSLDAHPLVREYFARQLRTQQPEAWRAAHRRLYEHLCATTKEGDEPTLEDLQPLYQAVTHGCQGNLQQGVLHEVYYARLQRKEERYSLYILGAHSSNLGAIACFFEQPGNRVSTSVDENGRGYLMNELAFCLRALGRVTEALDPMRAGLELATKLTHWGNAAWSANNLSELELALGDVIQAVRDAEQSVTHADRSDDAFLRLAFRATHAHALHQAGCWAESETRFGEAEQDQKKYQPSYPLLYSMQGFQYCDLLLTAAERAAWQIVQGLGTRGDGRELFQECRAVSHRAAQTLKWEEGMRGAPLLDFALNHLTLGRAALYEAILESSRRREEADLSAASPDFRLVTSAATLQTARRELDAAVDGLRRAGTQDHLPRGLLTRAWLRLLTGARNGPESAQEDLDEAWEIAERGPMKLFMADIHLYRARLFGVARGDGREASYPWESPAADLAASEKLINECGYHRRDEELADAKAALL